MNTKPCLIVFIATLVLIIVSVVIGNILESKVTLAKLSPNAVTGVKVFFFTLFGILVFSLIPLLLRYVISAQIKIGNGDIFVIKWIQLHEKGVVFGVWIFFVIGLCMAIPAAIKDGFFK